MMNTPYQIRYLTFPTKTINKLRESGYNNTLDLSDLEYQGELV